MPKITWVLVNCNSNKEAEKIGQKVLKERLVSCFDIFPRFKTAYFWPPKSREIKTAKGAILILETLKQKFGIIEKTTRKLHSDKLPFIGVIEIEVSPDYFDWIKTEIK